MSDHCVDFYNLALVSERVDAEQSCWWDDITPPVENSAPRLDQHFSIPNHVHREVSNVGLLESVYPKESAQVVETQLCLLVSSCRRNRPACVEWDLSCNEELITNDICVSIARSRG